MPHPFLDRLASGPILSDGAMGTMLHARGAALEQCLEELNLSKPDWVREVHLAYIRAGAEIITANTFRTHRRSLAKAGQGDRAEELTGLAVRLAREAVLACQDGCGLGPRRERFVAGSLAPLEDSYRPDLAPSAAECELEHTEMAQHLAAAGVDLLLVETMNTIREAVLATRAAQATGLPVITAFVCREDGRLFSGEAVSAAVEAVAPLGVVGLCINCTPVPLIGKPFKELRAAVQAVSKTPPLVGLYANIGQTDSIAGWSSTADVSPLEYARLAAKWMEQGARLLGGCCGSTPAHIAALRMVIG